MQTTTDINYFYPFTCLRLGGERPCESKDYTAENIAH